MPHLVYAAGEEKALGGPRLDYDAAADQFDRRYRAYAYPGIAAALRSLARLPGTERVLEVGCGTGHWLAHFAADGLVAHGIDSSRGMLDLARRRPQALMLCCGRAGHLPYRRAAFDLICCVNALHHFNDPGGFIQQARACLRRGSRLALIGLDPSDPRNHWFLYEYFERTFETDRARYPSVRAILGWMAAAGFEHVTHQTAEHIRNDLIGEAVLGDPFLEKRGTSQLMLLSDAEYAVGRARIEAAVRAAETAGEVLIFRVDLRLALVAGVAR